MATRTFGRSEISMMEKWLTANQDSASEKMVAELTTVIQMDYPACRIVPCNSCMGALHIALQTIGVGPGDEVIVDPIVVFAGMAAMYQNAVPVFADIDPETFNLLPKSVEKKISSRTKAIICTHHFGSVNDMPALMAIARKHGIPVIEDCAHTLFATQGDVYAGLLGDFAAFSFNHRKQLSTGQGGFLVINSKEWAEKSKESGFGRVPAKLTWNYAMPGVVAGLAMAQWEHAKQYVRRDHELAQRFNEAVGDCSWIRPQKILPSNWSAYHIWAARFDGDVRGIDYGAFMEKLKSNGGDYFLPSFIPYGAFGLMPSPVYRYPLFAEPRAYTKGCPQRCPHYSGDEKYGLGLCPNAEALVPRLLNTVLSPLDDSRIEKYAEALRKTVREYR